VAWFWRKGRALGGKERGDLFLGHANMICLIGRERRISSTAMWGRK